MKKILVAILIIVIVFSVFVVSSSAITNRYKIYDDDKLIIIVSNKTSYYNYTFPSNGDTYSVYEKSTGLLISKNLADGENWRIEIYYTSTYVEIGWNYVILKNDRTGEIAKEIWAYIFPSTSSMNSAVLEDIPQCPALLSIEETININVGEYLDVILPVEWVIEDLYFTPGLSFIKANSSGSDVVYKYLCYYGEEDGYELELNVGYYEDDIFHLMKIYHIKMYPSIQVTPENMTEIELYLQSIIDGCTDPVTGEVDTMGAMTELYIIMANKIEQMSALSYQNGYEKGRNDSVTSITNGSNLYGGIRAIIMSPIEFFRTVFNFEIDFGQGFHFNIYYFFTFLITIAIFIFVIKKLIGK